MGVRRPGVLVGAAAVALCSCLLANCSSSRPAADATPETSPTSQPPTSSAPAAATSTPPQTVVDLSGDTLTDAPIAGLVGLALSPDGRTLVTMRNTLAETVEVRAFPYEPNARLAPGAGRVLVDVPHPFVHSGGGLAFDRNGDLLVGIGALFRPDEPVGTRNPDGSILRIDADQVAAPDAESVPIDAEHLPVRGLRQPWRMSVDPATGDLWIGDVGENTAEEIDRISADQLGAGGVNLGWPFREGAESGPVEGDPPRGTIEPVWSRERRGIPAVNVVGGTVYRGTAAPWLAGRYVFSDFSSRVISALDPAGGAPVEIGLLDEHPTAIVAAPDGELWVLSAEGGVIQLVPTPDGERLKAQVVARIGSSTSPQAGEEATAMAFEPDGRALIVSDRSGRVVRLDLDAPDAAVCALQTLRLSPQLTYDPPERQRTELEHRVEVLDAAAPLLPSTLADDVDRLRRFHDEVIRVSSASGWSDPSVQQLLRLTSVERGAFPDVLRSENALANFATVRCPATPPAPSTSLATPQPGE